MIISVWAHALYWLRSSRGRARSLRFTSSSAPLGPSSKCSDKRGGSRGPAVATAGLLRSKLCCLRLPPVGCPLPDDSAIDNCLMALGSCWLAAIIFSTALLALKLSKNLLALACWCGPWSSFLNCRRFNLSTNRLQLPQAAKAQSKIVSGMCNSVLLLCCIWRLQRLLFLGLQARGRLPVFQRVLRPKLLMRNRHINPRHFLVLARVPIDCISSSSQQQIQYPSPSPWPRSCWWSVVTRQSEWNLQSMEPTGTTWMICWAPSCVLL